ncbi:sensor histidine kinase [Isoptericola croceus]|uniref:sensor histidine kinase n=1 Tax=Isoptericola croceus TaxID=3031406 RepID=UPI0023F9BF15|nr:sensor histidine kinase [Isoptericola croceus]
MSYLISTGPVGDGSWRWSLPTVLAFIGPGSVPLALLMLPLQATTLSSSSLADWGGIAAVLSSAAIVLARFRPLGAWGLAMATFAIAVVGPAQVWNGVWPVTPPLLFTLLVVQFAVARDKRVGVSIATWFATIVAGICAYWMFEIGVVNIRVVDGYYPPGFNPAADSVALTTTYTAFALLLGLLVRLRRQSRARVAQEEEVAAAERTRRHILEERARIARELHDVVAHHMSVISIQASTAEYRLNGLEESTREEFRSIGEQARESLIEMRRLLAVLRAEDESGERAPQPGPEQLELLAESAQRAGVPVTLTVSGLPDALPYAVALTVYRVTQEALSNVIRHAPGSRTEVEVRADDAEVVVTVTNAAPTDGTSSPEPHSAGFGLVGMRERVTFLDGTLETGPTPEGGFSVRARLPIEASESTA